MLTDVHGQKIEAKSCEAYVARRWCVQFHSSHTLSQAKKQKGASIFLLGEL